MKRLKVFGKFLLVLLVVLAVVYGIHCMRLQREYGSMKSCFGASYSELFQITLPGDAKTAGTVLENAEEAFSFIGTKEEAAARFGVLRRYCWKTEAHSTVSREEHQIKRIAAAFGKEYGTIWVVYSQTGFDEDGKKISGSSEVLSRWSIALQNGVWTVTEILEHP